MLARIQVPEEVVCTYVLSCWIYTPSPEGRRGHPASPWERGGSAQHSPRGLLPGLGSAWQTPVGSRTASCLAGCSGVTDRPQRGRGRAPSLPLSCPPSLCVSVSQPSSVSGALPLKRASSSKRLDTSSPEARAQVQGEAPALLSRAREGSLCPRSAFLSPASFQVILGPRNFSLSLPCEQEGPCGLASLCVSPTAGQGGSGRREHGLWRPG